MPKFYFPILFILTYLPGFGQIPNLHYGLETQGVVTSNNQVPFWLRSNQFGSVPLSGTSLSTIGRMNKSYDITRTRLLDWGVGFEGRANIGKGSEFLLIEGYGKARLGIFELKAGRSKEIMGLVDTTLSSGAFSISGNARGIPKIQLTIPDFYTIPFGKGMFAFKGNFAHGWIGKVLLGRPNLSMNKIVDQGFGYLHQKSLYGRLGRPKWKIKLYGGFNHQVTWGDNRPVYPFDYFTLSQWESYLYVISGKKYGGKGTNVERSKIGNHLGSIDVGLEYSLGSKKVFLYRQNLYDVGALYYFANILDGLNGISLINKKYLDSNNFFKWQKLVLEFLYTKNQAAESWSRIVPSGDEDYYNNYFYTQGWSYKGIGLGTPLITTKSAARAGLPSHPSDFFINNRVIAYYLAGQGKIGDWNYIVKGSYSRNFGTYGTSILGHSTGDKRFPSHNGIFKEVRQFSTFFETYKNINGGLNIGLQVAFDNGGLLYNSRGIILKMSKNL